MSKKSRLREHFDKQHGKRSESLLKSASEDLYYIHWSMPSQLSLKKSILLTCKILGLLLNTLVADEKYPVLNRENLTILIQMQLSKEQKTFSEFFFFFFALLKSILNYRHLQKNRRPSEILYFRNYRLRKRSQRNA